MVLEAGRRDTNANYAVPVFHAKSTEVPAFTREFFVRRYADEKQQVRNSKYLRDRECSGVFYLHAGTLGGCTARHAIITVYPHLSDWDAIATLTGDRSWAAKNMRRYFERLERCQYVSPIHVLFSGHGFSGWLPNPQGLSVAR